MADKCKELKIEEVVFDRSGYRYHGRIKALADEMRKEGLSKEGEFSVGNLAFKKLRNEGYIEKLIDIISGAYGRIYSE